MNLISSWVVRIGRQGRCAVGGLVLALTSSLVMGSSMSKAAADEPGRASPGAASFPFPTVRAEHRHVRELLANAMRYVASENRMIDPLTGYPFEGWNQDP